MNQAMFSIVHLGSRTGSIVAVLLLLLAASAPTNGDGAPSPKISLEQSRAAAEQVAQLIEKNYVFPEKRQRIADTIRRAASDHIYDVDDAYILADRLTTHLRAASNDAHLSVTFNPAGSSERHQHPSGPAQPDSAARLPGRDRNEGYEELKIFPGNIRYVKVTNFIWTEHVTAPVIDEVARFLANGDAVIIDLRGNGGGNASAVARFVSYFMKDEDQVLMTFYDGLSNDTFVSRVKDDLRAPRMVGKPLYTLIDIDTASAAEEFAYHVQQFKLGALVGEKTSGAANNNQHFAVQPGFIVSVSIGRPIHPVSKTNWEGSGIAPSDPVSAGSALDHAQLLALHRLVEQTSDPERKAAFNWAIQSVEARTHPFKLESCELDDYTGKYGIRTIRVENDSLVLQKDGRPPTKLMPLAPDLFGFARTDQVRLKFRRAGQRVVGFDQITDDGQVLPSQRDG